MTEEGGGGGEELPVGDVCGSNHDTSPLLVVWEEELDVGVGAAFHHAAGGGVEEEEGLEDEIGEVAIEADSNAASLSAGEFWKRAFEVLMDDLASIADDGAEKESKEVAEGVKEWAREDGNPPREGVEKSVKDGVAEASHIAFLDSWFAKVVFCQGTGVLRADGPW